MVFIVFTRAGFDLIALLSLPSSIWINPGILTQEEVAHLRATGREVVIFSTIVESDDGAALEAVVGTVKDHYDGRPVWVESPSSSPILEKVSAMVSAASAFGEAKSGMQAPIPQVEWS